jgi:hypothetical protein
MATFMVNANRFYGGGEGCCGWGYVAVAFVENIAAFSFGVNRSTAFFARSYWAFGCVALALPFLTWAAWCGVVRKYLLGGFIFSTSDRFKHRTVWALAVILW